MTISDVKRLHPIESCWQLTPQTEDRAHELAEVLFERIGGTAKLGYVLDVICWLADETRYRAFLCNLERRILFAYLVEVAIDALESRYA